MTKIGDLPDGEFQAPALILDGVVPFPDMEVAITLADEKNKAAIDVALEQQHLVAYIPKSQQSNYEKTIGTLTLIRRKKTNDEGINWVLIKGLWRIQIESPRMGVVSMAADSVVRFNKPAARHASTPRSKIWPVASWRIS